MFYVKEKFSFEDIFVGGRRVLDLDDRKIHFTCPGCGKKMKLWANQIAENCHPAEEGTSAYCPSCSKKLHKNGSGKYHVTWNDQEGIQHTRFFDSPEDARTEAAALREKYDGVKVHPRYIGEPWSSVVEMLALVSDVMRSANVSQEEIDRWVQTVSAQYGRPAPSPAELSESLANLDRRVDEAWKVLNAE